MKWILYPICALGGAAVTAGAIYLTGSSAPASSTPAPLPAISPSVMISGVVGAPGDGNDALSRALQTALTDAKVPTVTEPNRCTVAVSANVQTKTNGTAERISIVWQVQSTDGHTLGEVAQTNEVPEGALNGAWGEDARFAAIGARNGIIDILRRKRVGCS